MVAVYVETILDYTLYKRVSHFPVPSRYVTDQTLSGREKTKLFPPRKSLISDIPAGDGKPANSFLQCSLHRVLHLPHMLSHINRVALFLFHPPFPSSKGYQMMYIGGLSENFWSFLRWTVLALASLFPCGLKTRMRIKISGLRVCFSKCLLWPKLANKSIQGIILVNIMIFCLWYKSVHPPPPLPMLTVQANMYLLRGYRKTKRKGVGPCRCPS